MLSVNAIRGGYGGGIIINDLSFTILPGSVTGFCGRNGVGKTTLIRLVSGELLLSHGEISYSDNGGPEIINILSMNERRYLGIGVMPQEDLVFTSLSVKDNLQLTKNTCPIKLELMLDRFPILKQRYNIKAGLLSGGEKKILSFARTMAEKTNFICLDEPSEGVAQENIAIMTSLINSYKQDGASFLVCEQNITFLMSIAENFMVIDKGMEKFYKPKNETSYEELISLIQI